MIEAASIVYLAAAIGTGVLAVLAVVLPPERTRTTNYFGLFCGSVMVWAAGSVVALNLLDVPDPMVGDAFSGAHLVTMVMAVGVAFTPTFWLLFAMLRSGETRWTSGWRLWAVHAQSAFAFVTIVTNPYHQLSLYLTDEGSVAVGALGAVSLMWAWAYGFLGLGILVRYEWNRDVPGSRRRAASLMLGVLVILGGSILWAIPGMVAGGVPFFNPGPALFLVLAIILAHEVLRYGFSDVITPTAEVVFETVADAVLITDRHMLVIAANPTARSVLRAAEVSSRLDAALPELAKHASFCMDYACDDLAFEAEIDGAVYWGRVRRTTNSHGETTGAVIILTDLTDLRAAQRRLLAIGMDSESSQSTEEFIAEILRQR